MSQLLLCFAFLLRVFMVYGYDIRPECAPTTVSANATIGCPCVLPGERCADERSRCVKRGYQNICESLQCGISAIPQLKTQTEQRTQVKTADGHKIVGGTEAIPNSWPWQAIVFPPGTLCSGTIIDNEWVLTAAHCCKNRTTGITRLPTDYEVFVAAHNMTGDTDGQEVTVVSVVPHPRYDRINTGSWDYDVCLLKLAQPIVYGTKIQPACLATAYSALEAAGTTCHIVGWGTIASGGDIPNVLLQAAITIIDQKVCNTSYDGEITDRMICAAAPGIDSCQGDSGGPLICQDPTTQAWTLIGVTSFGRGCADPEFPGVYARVSTVLDFISATIGSSSY